MSDSKSRTEGRRKLKIGRREAHDIADPRPHLEVKRSKVKVIRPLRVAVQVTTCRVRGHIVVAALRAAQLVFVNLERLTVLLLAPVLALTGLHIVHFSGVDLP